MELPKWRDVTREERYFTSVLHHEIMNDIAPFSRLLCAQLGVGPGVAVSDAGFEVCFFRDGARNGVDIIERHRELEKQTFDFMIFLSDGSAAIIEAKAQQGYSNKQILKLEEARDIIEKSGKCPIRKVHLVGLCSSRYKLRPETEGRFSRVLRWKDLVDEEVYPKSRDHFIHADNIYHE